MPRNVGRMRHPGQPGYRMMCRTCSQTLRVSHRNCTVNLVLFINRRQSGPSVPVWTLQLRLWKKGGDEHLPYRESHTDDRPIILEPVAVVSEFRKTAALEAGSNSRVFGSEIGADGRPVFPFHAYKRAFTITAAGKQLEISPPTRVGCGYWSSDDHGTAKRVSGSEWVLSATKSIRTNPEQRRIEHRDRHCARMADRHWIASPIRESAIRPPALPTLVTDL